METESIVINKVKYLIPNEIKQSKRKHRQNKGWINLYFFKKRQKKKVEKKWVQDDLIITSKLEYQKGIFYKMSSLSKSDDTFDFYYKLKDTAPKNIVKKNLRNRKKCLKEKQSQIDRKDYEWTNDGKVVVRFF